MNMFYRKVVSPLCLGAVLTGLAATSACSKKDKGSNSNTGGNTTGTVNTEDSLKYRMYRNMQVDFFDVNGGEDAPGYFWYKSVPSLNPYSSSYAKADDLLSAMKGYAINPATNSAYDRYSFLDRDSTISTQLQDGQVETTQAVTGDFGLEIAFAADPSGGVHTLVLYADKNSPAGKANLTRGVELTSINNITDFSSTTNRQSVIDAIYSSTTGVLTLKTKVVSSASGSGIGTTGSVTLNAAAYAINPILFDTIYNSNQGKVGYFVFYTFTNTYNSAGQPSLTKQLLDAEVTKLKAANVNNVIVDLRNNGGGSVATAEYLDSVLAPASAAGKVMYYTTYNDKLNANQGLGSQGEATKFSTTNMGVLPALKNVFFVANEYTASAAELTINNLKPYYANMKLVADTNTYGKPVGFIGTRLQANISNKQTFLADLYAINFATHNALGNGDYYTGLVPDQKAIDYVDIAWGDLEDPALAGIMSYINNGSFSGGRLATSADIGSHRVRTSVLKAQSRSLRFNGMVDFRGAQKK